MFWHCKNPSEFIISIILLILHNNIKQFLHKAQLGPGPRCALWDRGEGWLERRLVGLEWGYVEWVGLEEK